VNSIENFMENLMENVIEFHGIPWNFTAFHEIFHEISWKRFHGKNPSNVYVKFHGIS
jgi:hypothetical protein